MDITDMGFCCGPCRLPVIKGGIVCASVGIGMNALVVVYLIVSSCIAMYETATIPGPFHLTIGMMHLSSVIFYILALCSQLARIRWLFWVYFDWAAIVMAAQLVSCLHYIFFYTYQQPFDMPKQLLKPDPKAMLQQNLDFYRDFAWLVICIVYMATFFCTNAWFFPVIYRAYKCLIVKMPPGHCGGGAIGNNLCGCGGGRRCPLH